MKDENTVTVAQAAKELHMDAMTVRYLMRSGALRIGDCGRRPGCARSFYRIYRKQLDKAKEERGL